MNQPMKKHTESYKPSVVPMALKVIAGGLRHVTKSTLTREQLKGEHTMTAHLTKQKPILIHNVRDVKSSAEWYRDNLGFEIGPHEFGTFAEMQLDGEYIFHLSHAWEPAEPLRLPVFSFMSQDIEMTHAVLQSRGVTVEPIQWFPDYSSFTFRDLDGHAVAINQSFEIRMKDLEPLQLVGYRITLSEGIDRTAAIQETANRLRERVPEMTHAIDPFFMIGAYLPSQADYWVGLQVSKIESIPEGMEAVTLPAQRYAVKWHYGLRSDVQQTYARMNELLAQAGITADNQAWRVEMTRNWGSKSEEEELEMDLYMAVE
jgi:Uncharacterized protein conserved in bacteria